MEAYHEEPFTREEIIIVLYDMCNRCLAQMLSQSSLQPIFYAWHFIVSCKRTLNNGAGGYVEAGVIII